MDKSWTHMCKNSQAYDDGVSAFLNNAFAHGYVNNEGLIRCPCIDCKNFNFKDRDTIYDHLVCRGMLGTYTTWYHHGEKTKTMQDTPTMVENREDAISNNVNDDNISGMLQDLFPNANEDMVHEVAGTEGSSCRTVGGDFHKLLKDAKKQLYPGCEKTTMLAFLIRMWHFKCLGGWSNKTFNMMLQLLSPSMW